MSPTIATILLTPFRVQNVPPPMASCQLTLSFSTSPAAHNWRTPIHAAFCSVSDVLAVLWESGDVELWSLNTHLGGGREEVMNPSRTWAGRLDDDTATGCRQIMLFGSGVAGVASTVVVLGSGRQNDVVTMLELQDQKLVSSRDIQLPVANCRLISTGEQGIIYEGPSGKISRCRCN